jgi:hypothetical protein
MPKVCAQPPTDCHRTSCQCTASQTKTVVDDDQLLSSCHLAPMQLWLGPNRLVALMHGHYVRTCCWPCMHAASPIELRAVVEVISHLHTAESSTCNTS